MRYSIAWMSVGFMSVTMLSLAACAQDKSVPSKPIGMANPASQYCASLGGILEIKRQADGGEYGVCHLPNGTTIDEWELFRRDHKGAKM